MEPLELVALMAATLRAGKGGRSDAAWREATEEAVYGLSVILHNEAGIRQQLQNALPEPSRIASPPGLLVPN